MKRSYGIRDAYNLGVETHGLDRQVSNEKINGYSPEELELHRREISSKRIEASENRMSIRNKKLLERIAFKAGYFFERRI